MPKRGILEGSVGILQQDAAFARVIAVEIPQPDWQGRHCNTDGRAEVLGKPVVCIPVKALERKARPLGSCPTRKTEICRTLSSPKCTTG